MSEEFEYKEEWQYPITVVLNLTDDCNLACRYCFVQQKPNYITLDTAKQVVDWMVNNLNIQKEKKIIEENRKCQLVFFGGEPTLLFYPVIKPLVEYINTKYNDLFIFSITTNGTLLNKEMIDFFIKYNFYLLLSIDGNEDTQNYNRPCRDKKIKSFDLVSQNIPYLLEKFPKLTFRSTIYEPTVNELFNNYLFAESLGFQNMFFVPDCRHGKWKAENIKILEKQLTLIFNYRLNQYLNNIKPIHFSKIDESYKILLAIDTNRDKSKRHVNRCGLGTTICSVNYAGDIFTCQEQDTRIDTNNIFHIGNIYSGINIKKHKNLLEQYYSINKMKCENIELCNNCLLHNYCLTHNCPSTMYDLFNNFYTYSEIMCLFHQMILKRSMLNMKILVENNNEIFKEYLFKLYRHHLGKNIEQEEEINNG